MKPTEEIKKMLHTENDGFANLIMASALSEEALATVFRKSSEKASALSGDRPKNHIPFILESMDIDVSPITDGMDEEELDLFCCLLSLWMGMVEDATSASVFVLMLRRYLLPMAQKKRSLEKAITLLGKEA